jgi:hypothetical protein
MEKHTPIEISDAEWQEIMQVRAVREGWELEKDDTVESFKERVYGVKFDFTSGSPGYSGDIFIIQNDTLEPPLVLVRKDGKLKK